MTLHDIPAALLLALLGGVLAADLVGWLAARRGAVGEGR